MPLVATGMGSATCPEWLVQMSADFGFESQVRTWLHVPFSDNGLALATLDDCIGAQTKPGQWIKHFKHLSCSLEGKWACIAIHEAGSIMAGYDQSAAF